MEFLVAIELRLPDGMEEVTRARLHEAERLRAGELAAEGTLVRLWRVPGRRANWGLWKASDATALHAALASLPLWPWIDATVHPLADHDNDPRRVR